LNKPIFPAISKTVNLLRPFNLMLGSLLVYLPCVFITRWLNQELGVEWMVVMCCVLLYCWLSMIIGFLAENYWRFLGATLLCYVVLVLVLFFATAYLSGTRFYDFYSYNQFFKASNVFYIVGLFMALVLRTVASFLESQ